MLPVTVVHQVPGGAPFELTPIAESVSYDSAAVGGFGGMECQVAGDVRKRLGYLGLTRVMYGSTVLWEGQLEDMPLAVGAGSVRTTLRAFGWRRLLDETSVRRIWSKRDLSLANINQPVGAAIPFTPGAGGGQIARSNLVTTIGKYDQTSANIGVRFSGNGVSVPSAAGEIVWQWIGPGVTILKILGTDSRSGPNAGQFQGRLFFWTVANSSSIDFTDVGFSGTIASNAASAGRDAFGIGVYNSNAGPITFTTTDVADFFDLRILGTVLVEDVAGGFYGGTILRDLISLVPGLTTGIIEDGSDYTIQAVERRVRAAAMSVVSEVVGYYTREWAVWEDGRFDWLTRNLDEPQIVIPVAQFTTLEIDGTLDGLARTVYVLYSDAASGLDAEASSVSTDPRNPYVRQTRTKDITVQPGFPMTANTSAQLAARVAGDIAARPAVSGRCSLPATALVNNLVGSPKPAALIRGGENILIPDLPKTDPFRTGRDGETLFHVAASHVDLSTNTVTLELEGQQSRADVILARLAASTRVLTG